MHRSARKSGKRDCGRCYRCGDERDEQDVLSALQFTQNRADDPVENGGLAGLCMPSLLILLAHQRVGFVHPSRVLRQTVCLNSRADCSFHRLSARSCKQKSDGNGSASFTAPRCEGHLNLHMSFCVAEKPLAPEAWRKDALTQMLANRRTYSTLPTFLLADRGQQRRRGYVNSGIAQKISSASRRRVRPTLRYDSYG